MGGGCYYREGGGVTIEREVGGGCYYREGGGVTIERGGVTIESGVGGVCKGPYPLGDFEKIGAIVSGRRPIIAQL